ncbi:MAG: hypothetical protein HOD11_13310 [Candidatus Marinimicrobia bacterium]|nr:hypothetical protein [Candidatus Neomarinimicrobiota bacterium]MBT5268538.1 hypothetical protein [Candidatus Neomarinimicrobiota bacterium]
MTAQVHEKIRYQGKRMRLASTPPFPTNHPKIIMLTDEEFRVGASLMFANNQIELGQPL